MDEHAQTLVLDASVVAKWFINESDSAVASRLLDQAAERRWIFAAPDLIRLELSHVFWKRRTQGYTQKQLEHACGELSRLAVQEVPIGMLIPGALRLAYKADIAVYDACYVALAQSLKSSLATFDLELIKKIKRHSLVSLHRWDEPDEEPGKAEKTTSS